MDAKYYNGEPTDPWPSVEDAEDDDRCVYCDCRDTEPHHPACRLYVPDPLTPEQRTERAAFRRMQAAQASRTQIAAWLRKHAKGMKPGSHNALYLQRAAELIEAEAVR